MKKEIIVALISAVSGILIALIGSSIHYKSINQDKAKYYLKITDINLENSVDIEGIRIIGRINDIDFSYPNCSFVIEPGYFIPNQKFEIEDNNGFNCYFEVVVLDSLCRFHYLRPLDTFIIKESEFDYSGVYKVNLIENITNALNDSISLCCMIEFKIY